MAGVGAWGRPAYRSFGAEPCHVWGGAFALSMQACLFLVVVVALVWVKVREHGSRTWFEFGLDTSKQMIGSGWMHIANMLCAMIFASTSVEAVIDECSWYATNLILDTTLGVFVEWALLTALAQVVRHCCARRAADIMETGSYWTGSGPSRQFRFGNYACQLVTWLAIVTLMKLCVVLAMRTDTSPAVAIDAALSIFEGSPRRKLFVCMICIPGVMNVVQFVVTDRFIKKSTPREPPFCDVERELNAPSHG